MHLDMNPHHTGFMYTAVDDIKTKKYKAQLVSSDMDINAERYIEYATKDFFYVMLRDPAPAPKPGFSWEVSAGAQPSPTWMPAVHAGRWQEKEEAVDLIEVPLARASFRLRAGTREPDAGTGAVPSHELSEEDSRHVLFATTMGVASEKRVRGLGTDGKLVLPAGGGSRDFPTALVSVGPHRGVSFQILDGQPSEPPTLEPHEDVAELPLLLRDGQPLAAASVRGGTLPRGALGVTEDGRVVIAQGLLPSHGPIIEALRRLGCAHAVALDRGFSSTAHTDRAGTGREPKASYEETTLYVVSEPMAPRVRRFSASKPSP
jgi:hypothetical protein